MRTASTSCACADPVAQPQPNRRDDYTPRAAGNRLSNISGRSTDFVVTGNQQQDCLVENVTSADTTNMSVPPHAIYMQNPGATEAFCGFSQNLTIRNVVVRNNKYGQAVKVSDARGLVIDRVTAIDCLGAVLVSTTDGGRVGRVSARISAEPGQRNVAGVIVSQSNRVSIVHTQIDYAPGAFCSAVTLEHGAREVEVSDVTVLDRSGGGSHAAAFRVFGRSEGRFTRCTRTRLGADVPMFSVDEGSTIIIASCDNQKSGRLIQAAAGAHAWIDRRVDGPSAVAGEGEVRLGTPSLPHAVALPGAAGAPCRN